MRLTEVPLVDRTARLASAMSHWAITDLVAEGPFSQAALEDKVWGEWLGVAMGKQEYLHGIREAGFKNLLVVRETTFPMAEQDERLKERIVSIAVTACK